MEQAGQTLHDFVLNLLSDSQALTAFEQDPAAVLDHAGLSDISAADVQEVIPLVVDMVPQADALEGVLNQLPVDSLDSGQLGAIQQLQFVTSALGGLPVLETGNIAFGNPDLNGVLQLDTDPSGHMNGAGFLNTPMGAGAATVSGDLAHGLTAALFDSTDLGSGSTGFINVPGLDSLGALGGGLPSGFSAMSDVTDALDGQAGSFTNSANAAASLLSGAAEMTTGALTNPGELVNVLSDPAAAISGLTGTVESFASEAAAAVPGPGAPLAGEAVQTVSSATSGVVDFATSHLATGPLGAVTGSLPTDEVTHALAPVEGVVQQVTGSLGGGALSDVTGSLTDPTHALSTITSTVSTVQGTLSDTVGSVASHSAVSDVTNTAGLGNLLGSASNHADVTGLTGELGHVTDALHLPGL